MSGQLSPDRAVKLLRAKAAELRATVSAAHKTHSPIDVPMLAADIALVAQLLADHIQRNETDLP